MEWANRKLRFGISILQGKVESSLWKRRFQSALSIKEELQEHGYKWQAERLENWIHRLQKAELAKDEARIQAFQARQKSCSSSELTSQREREREEGSF